VGDVKRILNWARATSLRQRGENIWETYEKNKLLNNDRVTSIEIIDPKTKKSKGFIKDCNG